MVIVGARESVLIYNSLCTRNSCEGRAGRLTILSSTSFGESGADDILDRTGRLGRLDLKPTVSL